VDWQKRDRYKRIVGKVLMGDRDVCLEQVRAGLAWHYMHYQGEQTPTDRFRYATAEQEAHDAGRGLWADPDPIPPWEWGRGRRSAEGEQAAERPAEDVGRDALSQ